MKRHLLVTLVGLAMIAALPAAADDDDDQDRARAAVEAGQIRPLAQLLGEVERRYVGQVVETELEHDDGRWTYKFKLLPASGRLYRVVVDGATGAVVSTRGPAQERR
jgi:uncharacterized membrane protein YkoI